MMETKQGLSEVQLVDMMHAAGLRPSAQRLAVLSFVANTRSHPSADEVYNELSSRFPTLSRTTVYNSLHALVEVSLIRELEIESDNMHYDLAPQPPHGHFICRKCGKIFDTSMPGNLAGTVSEDFEIDCVDIFFKGTCPQCS